MSRDDLELEELDALRRYVQHFSEAPDAGHFVQGTQGSSLLTPKTKSPRPPAVDDSAQKIPTTTQVIWVVIPRKEREIGKDESAMELPPLPNTSESA